MKFTLAVLGLSSIIGPANAALRNSTALVITSDDRPGFHDTPVSFGGGSSTTACDPKCVGPAGGDDACIGVDQSKVGCGSCLDFWACNKYTGDSIGENSCRGWNSCSFATAIIGKNSCNANDACYDATGYIPDNQCNSQSECFEEHFPALSLYKNGLTGECKDFKGWAFSTVRINTSLLAVTFGANAEACAQFCRQPTLNNGFQVGMQFNTRRFKGECSCLYDRRENLPEGIIPQGARKAVYWGRGRVARGSQGFPPSLKCYPLKVVNNVDHSLNEPTLTID